jgi:ketosteroid isomerase-like protein
VVPVGCEGTASRTERVVVQGDIVSGTYQVRLTGKSCGDGTPAQITTLLTVLTETGPKCQGVFVNVPVGQTVNGCSF